jgi:Thioredoxin domain
MIRKVNDHDKIDTLLIKATDIQEKIKIGLMMTPELVIDEEMESNGFILKERLILK